MDKNNTFLIFSLLSDDTQVSPNYTKWSLLLKYRL